MALDTLNSAREFVTAVYDKRSQYGTDEFNIVSKYGEPGYECEGFVVLANHWCACGEGDLHAIDSHYPAAFTKLRDDLGVEFGWSDEWVIDWESDKAYRTSPDSYSWQPSYVLTDRGDMLTPDNDVEDFVEWAGNDPDRVIPSSIYGAADLLAAGFTRYNDYAYENGWHPGQDDTPRDVVERFEADPTTPEDCVWVFALDESSQFYIRFSLYYRARD
jgi:hypothetical protein